MKIRQYIASETPKENEFIINSKTIGKIVIKIDYTKVHCLTLGYTSYALQNSIAKNIVDDFLVDNIDIFNKSVKSEIQYVMDSMSEVFCTDEDELKHIKQNFYKFNSKLEKMIFLLIRRNITNIMLEVYKKQKDN